MNGRTQAVLDFVKQYRTKKGISPSYREIGKGCGITSTSNVRYHLDILERDSLIKRHAGVARGIVVNESQTVV